MHSKRTARFAIVFAVLAWAGRFPALAREFVGEKAVLTAIRDDLRQEPAADRPFFRYFTLNHLHNNPNVSDLDLDVQRAALSKIVNSLSWEKEIVLPRAVDAAKTVYRVDLRRLGWQKPEMWDAVERADPYGRGLTRDPERVEIKNLSGVNTIAVRSDWFVVTASRPPLYHLFLDLPLRDTDLEERLGINVQFDFQNNRLSRAAFNGSLVSNHNRLLDRHASKYGAYWKSYDFANSDGRGSLARFPLGPSFSDNPHQAEAFDHAGGEIIFDLPNGLHGYMITDNRGRRLDEAPVGVVSDDNRAAGTAVVVNGLSCINCHKGGINNFHDEIGLTAKNSYAFDKPAREKIAALYPEAERMQAIYRTDRARYQEAVRRVVEPFLGDKAREPVGSVSARYLADLTADDVAFELGLGGAEQLKLSILSDVKIQRLGLSPLLGENGVIKRSAWQAFDGGRSTLQQAADLEAPPVEGAPLAAPSVVEFRPSDTVSFVLPLDLNAGSKIELQLYHLDTRSLVSRTHVDSKQAGNRLVRFSVDPERRGTWAVGDYRLDALVDGVAQSRKNFKVKP